jgi:transcriptional regulator with XRE-family HTH domain
VARRGRFSKEPFGDTLQTLMAETKTTFRVLGERKGLSAGYLNHLAHGNRPAPSSDVIASIARGLGVDPDHFREYRIRLVVERLEASPSQLDRLYRRLVD